MKIEKSETKELVDKLRQRLGRGLFSTYATMEEAAVYLENFHDYVEQLHQQVSLAEDRYKFVLQQWMAERLISDNLYVDLLVMINTYNSSNDSHIVPTPYMEQYQQSRRNGTIVI
jgi:hypothetical protein